MPNYDITVGPFLTDDGVKILAMDAGGKRFNLSEKFTLEPGQSVTVRAGKTSSRSGLIINEVRLYEDDDAANAKGELIARIRSTRRSIPGLDAEVEFSRDRVRLLHKGRKADSYRFAVDFVNEAPNTYFTWDPDVHETLP